VRPIAEAQAHAVALQEAQQMSATNSHSAVEAPGCAHCMSCPDPKCPAKRTAQPCVVVPLAAWQEALRIVALTDPQCAANLLAAERNPER